MTEQNDMNRHYGQIEDNPVPEAPAEQLVPVPVSASYVVDSQGVHDVRHVDVPSAYPEGAFDEDAQPDETLEDNVTIQPADVVPAATGEEDVTADTEKVLRVSERVPLVMNRKEDRVVIGTAVITTYEARAEITCELIATEEAAEAVALFSSNIVGGISMGAILSEEAQVKLSEHLNRQK